LICFVFVTILYSSGFGHEKQEDFMEDVFKQYTPAMKGFVKSLCMEFPEVEFDDLFQEFSLEFVCIYRKFRSDEGKFGSYFFPCMQTFYKNRRRMLIRSRLQAIKAAIEVVALIDVSNLPDRQYDEYCRMKRQCSEIERLLSKRPVVVEMFSLLKHGYKACDVAKMLGCSAFDVANAMKRYIKPSIREAMANVC
jgi:RNA polymerase sigma factor (sigma-70 family)